MEIDQNELQSCLGHLMKPESLNLASDVSFSSVAEGVNPEDLPAEKIREIENEMQRLGFNVAEIKRLQSFIRSNEDYLMLAHKLSSGPKSKAGKCDPEQFARVFTKAQGPGPEDFKKEKQVQEGGEGETTFEYLYSVLRAMSLNNDIVNSAMVYAELYKKKSEEVGVSSWKEQKGEKRSPSRMQEQVDQIHKFLFGQNAQLVNNVTLEQNEWTDPLKSGWKEPLTRGREDQEQEEPVDCAQAVSGKPKNEGPTEKTAKKWRPKQDEEDMPELDYHSNNRLFKLITSKLSFKKSDFDLIKLRMKRLLNPKNGMLKEHGSEGEGG